jgi:hypothetical protein
MEEAAEEKEEAADEKGDGSGDVVMLGEVRRCRLTLSNPS